ncbi:hypothetical protein JW698_00730 [Candidatus Wolfebacteria bacterium]|nr:hypothetical protein [Candidatus Wolfebacteria bacterium]
MKKRFESGQYLIEVIIGVTIGAILIGAGITAIVPILKNNLETKNVQIASPLIQEYLEIIKNIAESSWFNIYNPPAEKGISSQFYLVSTSTAYQIFSGTTSTIIEGLSFNRSFSIENVNRELCGAGNVTTNSITSCDNGPGGLGVADDPSTQKITVTVSWDGGGLISRSQYFTRNRNKTFIQTNWTGGTGQEGPVIEENDKFATSTEIDYSVLIGSITIEGIQN